MRTLIPSFPYVIQTKNDLGEVEKRTKENTEQTDIKTTRELFGVGNGCENKAWSQITFRILTMSCLASLKDFASILSK